MRPLILLLCLCFGVQGMKGISNKTLGTLPIKERNRRLIPYMTYYLGQPQNAQYRQVMTVPYVSVPQFRPTHQRFIQQSTPLTRMITQNYLAITKQLPGNPRLHTRVNPNIYPEMKYYANIQNQQQNIPHQVYPAQVQYSKPQNIIQYVKPEVEGQYHREVDNTYEQRESDPQDNVQYTKPEAHENYQYAKPEVQSNLQYAKPEAQSNLDYAKPEAHDNLRYAKPEAHDNLEYAKPAPDTLLQYVKPEVQQYVTKYTQPNIQYTKNEQEDYEDEGNPRSPIQYATKPDEPQTYALKPEFQYAKNIQPIQYITKNGERIYIRKPLIRFRPITPANLEPLPADIPEYINRPVQKALTQPSKDEQTSVTITQSQELDVDALPSTPSPNPKYHATYVEKPDSYLAYDPPQSYQKDQELPEEDLDPETVDQNLNNLLQGVSLSKSLPERITSENLDSSIRTLSKILRILQRAHALPHSAKEVVRGFPKPTTTRQRVSGIRLPPKSQFNDGSTPGRPGIDYPNYEEIPPTSFSCKEQRYKGFFGDPETGCQVWHYCDLNGGQASFLCPNGTIFSQVALTCDWWFNVKCSTTAQLYVLNERLYKYILPQKPSFPEDYSGPLVDHYLSLKFKEIEEKNKNKTEVHEEETKGDEDIEPPFSIDTVSQNKVRSLG